MFLLPRRNGIEKDELLLSYALRNWNKGYENFKDFCNHYFVPSDYKNHVLSAESVRLLESEKTDRQSKMEIYLGGIAAQEKMEIPEAFLKHSMYPLEFPLLLQSNQGKVIANLFSSYPVEICPSGNSPLRTVRYCPECLEKDLLNRGEFSLYRKHQIPFIKCCPVHGTELITIDNPLEVDLTQKPDNLEIRKSALEDFRFSKFCWSFLQHQTCLEDVSYGLFNSLSPSGFTSKSGIKDLYKKAKPWLGDISEHQLAVCINQLTSPTYINKDILLRLIWFCKENDIRYSLPEPSEITKQLSFVLDPHWSVSTANNYLAVIENTRTNQIFYISPSQIASGWPLPDTMLSLTDLAARIITGITDGEYELVDTFSNAEIPVNIKHVSCGNIQKWKFRTFVYEGVRCPCESQITLQDAKKAIEDTGEFELIEFKGANHPVTIRHKVCNRSFTISYHKFIQRPWCKVCNPKSRDGEYFKQQVRDLVGDEYIVLGDYIDSHTPILMLHNLEYCQREFTISPSHFLKGGRCTKCTGLVRDEEFKELVKALSADEYRILQKATKNLYEIQNTGTGEIQKLSKAMILQELRRFTPSPILPVTTSISNEGNANTETTEKNISALLRKWILTQYRNDQLIFIEDIPQNISISGKPIFIPYPKTKSVFSRLVKNGILNRVQPGVFCFKNSSFNDLDVIKAKYILRNGKRIGYITGTSMAYQLGLCEKPELLQIATNKEAGTHGRTVKCGEVKVKIKGPLTPITEDNHIILSLLDILQFGKKYLKSQSDYREIGSFIRDKGIRIDDFSDYLPLYPTYTRNFLIRIFKQEVWNESPH